MDYQPTTRWKPRWMAIVAITAMAVSATASQVDAGTEPPSPATGDARVIAQGLVDVDDAEQQWSFVARDVDADGVDTEQSEPTFVIVAGGDPMLVEGSDGVRARLAPDEAVFRPAGETAERTLRGGASSTAEISIAPPGTAGVGDPFSPGAGTHDLDLVHDRLEPGEFLELRSVLPALVYVASGAVTENGSGTEVAAGGTAVLSGDLTLTGGGDGPTTVFVAVIGPVLDLSLPTSTTVIPSTTARVPTVPAGTTPTEPPPTSPPPTEPPPTSPPPTAEPTTTEPATTPSSTVPVDDATDN